MYINMYGCDQYGYSAWPQYCTDPHASGAIAAIFFVIFVIIGGLVLLTLFVGVVSTSMDEAQKEQQAELFIEARVKYLQDEVRRIARTKPSEERERRDTNNILNSLYSILTCRFAPHASPRPTSTRERWTT